MRNEINVVVSLVESLKKSLDKYDKASRTGGKPMLCGYDIDREDSKESIQRRIIVIREELLKLSKSL